MREPLTETDLDAAELSVGSHHGAADQFLAWAQDPREEDVVSAKELVVRAGEHLELAADEPGAEALYRRALTMAGQATLDPRCHLTALLLQRGDVAEAGELDQELRRSRPDAAPVYEYMAEIWQTFGDTRRAMGWYNRAIRRHEREAWSADDLGLLCSRRWRLREAAGHPPDDYDLIGLGWREQRRQQREAHRD